MLNLLAAQAQTKNLELLTAISPDIPEIVRGDPVRVRQVFMNLVGNAVKFTEQGEVVIRVELDERLGEGAGRSGSLLRCTISDTGPGISEADRLRLFRPFTQVNGSASRKHGGTGLGLAITKRLVELMGGEIGVGSQAGHGSTFWFTMELQHTSGALPSSGERSDWSAHRVLVVDNSFASQELIQRYLNAWSITRVDQAGVAGAPAMLQRACADGDPYLIAIVDAVLVSSSDRDQLQATVRAATAAGSRIILLTTVDKQRSARQLFGSEIVAYLSKPVRQSQLFDCLTTMLTMAHSHLPVVQLGVGISEAPVLRTAPPNGPGPLILLAEDNRVNLKVVARQLQRLGMTTQYVMNGQEAVTEALRTDYTLILMDCQMPVMDGFEATHAIRVAERNREHRAAIIALTANAMEGDREACIAAGMDDYLSKPFNTEQLREVLWHWLPLAAENAVTPQAIG